MLFWRLSTRYQQHCLTTALLDSDGCVVITLEGGEAVQGIHPEGSPTYQCQTWGCRLQDPRGEEVREREHFSHPTCQKVFQVS